MKRNVLLFYVPFWLWIAALFTGTSLPGSSVPLPDFQFSDKIAHFLAYAGVSFFMLRMMPYLEHSFWSTKMTSKTAIISILTGIMDELHQIPIPGRDASIYDLTADVIGIILGILLYKMVKKYIPQIT